MSQKSNNVVIFIGAPGSGKGSLSRFVIEKFGWEQLSTGNLCRKNIDEQTEIGKQMDFFIKSGKLVPDSIIIEMVNQWLTEQLLSGKNVILDGYPRTVAQAEALDKFLDEKFVDTSVRVVKFDVSDDIVIERLCERYVCQNGDCQAVYSMATGSSLRPKKDMICDICSSPLKRRSDDTKEAIAHRLEVYHEHKNKLLDYYRNKAQHIDKIDVKRPLNEIFEDFKQLVGLED